MYRLRFAKPLIISTTALTVAVATYSLTAQRASALTDPHAQVSRLVPKQPSLPPSRESLITRLKSSSSGDPNTIYDIVVIGGGATGTGVALDAASRGLKVALLERDDFSSGTSSRSTKLVHGGVRYLEKAFWNLDYDQYNLVREALHERKVFLETAPHLSFALPIMIPLYSWWQLPYFWVGVKAYDLLAGKQNLESSYLLGRGRAIEAFPMLSNDELKGAVVYYDGSHNDSRMNVSIALTAVDEGATVVNHMEVTKIEKNDQGKINGVIAQDTLDPKSKPFHISTRSVVNATGPFCDSIRKLDDQKVSEIVAPSSGVHIVLPGYYSPKRLGLLDPATSDGRVIFFLPWQGSTIAGTTDQPTAIKPNLTPSNEDIEFILEEVRRYFKGKVEVRKEDILAAWSGIRPLVRDPKAKNTESLVRNHLITLSDSGLVTIAGGKWTTYRQMAEETVEECIKEFDLKPTGPGATEKLKLVGSEGWNNLLYVDLIQHYNLDPEVAKHLSDNYGTRAFTVASLAGKPDPSLPHSTGTAGNKILAPYPFIDGELKYAIQYEYATTAVDFLARRIRLAFLDCHAALEALPKVVKLMGDELGWDSKRRAKEFEDGKEFLKGMGLETLTRNVDDK